MARLVVYSPIAFPVKGGASSYVSLLTSGLGESVPQVSLIIVTKFNLNAPIVEKSSNSLLIRILMPGLALKPDRYLFLRIFSTIWNIFIFNVIAVVSGRHRKLLIHYQCLENRPFAGVLKLLHKKNAIIDVRGDFDQRKLARYMKNENGLKFIACSEVLTNKIRAISCDASVKHIPIPMNLTSSVLTKTLLVHRIRDNCRNS